MVDMKNSVSQVNPQWKASQASPASPAEWIMWKTARAERQSTGTGSLTKSQWEI